MNVCPNCEKGGDVCRCTWEEIAAAYERRGMANEADVARRLGVAQRGEALSPSQERNEP